MERGSERYLWEGWEAKSSHSAVCDSVYDAFENTSVIPFALISSLMPAFQACRVPEV